MVRVVENTLESLTELLEALFIPILAIEIIWLWRRGNLKGPRIKEMAANASSVLVVVPAGIVGFVLWFSIFDAIDHAVPWSIPTTWATVIVAVLLADFVYYWEHRFEHTHRLPWDLYHSVHHSSESYDQTTGLRLGAFDALLTFGYTMPLVIVGFDPLIAMAATGVVIGYQTWIHTEVINRMPRWFEAVFNTPSHHRGHHGAHYPYLDTNYGAVLIVWDRLFGTFQPEIERPAYGLTTQIGTSNPVAIQLSQLRLLWADLKADTSWSTRFARLWRRPGWQPQEVPVAA